MWVCSQVGQIQNNDSILENLEEALGAVHKLRLQEEGVGGQKNQLFVNFYTIENVNGGG